MTSPTSVGSASVDIEADLKGFAKGLRKQLEEAFKGLDFSKLIEDSFGKKPVNLPVTPDFDTDSIPEKVKKTRVPKVPVVVDPLFDAFRAELKKQSAALAKQVNVKVPVDGDTAGLRAELGSQLAALGQQLRVKIPAEPEDRAKLQAKLQEQLAEISSRVKAHVGVEPDTAGYEAKVRAVLARSATQKVKLDVDRGNLGSFNAIGGLFKNIIPDIGGVGSAIRGLASGVQQFATQAAQGGSQLAGSIASAAGPIGTIISLLASAATTMGLLSGAAILAVPALTAVAGAAAAIPAALSGLGAAFGTLSLGFKGIEAAFKPKAAGGGGGAGNSAAQQARQVASAARQVEAARRGIASANRGLEASERSLASAERGVVTAQQTLVDAEHRVVLAQDRARLAQLAVSKARKDAVEDIDDLGRALRGAQIGEKEAAQAVQDALRDLNSAKLTGVIPDITRAQNAYDRAVLSLEDAKDATGDLQEQSDESAKKGVEGSDKVQDALRDQAQAYDGVKDAQQGVIAAQNGIIDAADSLKSAQDGVLSAQDGIKSATDGLISAQDSLAQAQTKTAGGAAKVTKEVVKLAPAAQAFVNAVKALKPAFESLRLDVQQRLFQGLDQTVTNLGAAWIPALKVTLGSYADTFNTFFKNLGAGISTPKFISDIQAGAEGFRQLLADVGQSVTSKLVPAFGALSKAAAPFLVTLGKELASIVTSFSNWVLAGEKSGGLRTFFDKAGAALHDIFTTGKLVTQIIGDIFSIITGAQQTGDNSPIDSLNRGLDKVHAWLSDPANQQQLRDFVAGLAGGLVAFGQTVQTINTWLNNLSGDNSGKAGSVGASIGRALVAGLAAGIFEAFKANLELIWTPFQQVIDAVKQLFGIKSPSTVFASIGRNIVLGLLNGITSMLGTLRNIAVNIRNTVVNAVAGAGSWLVAGGRNAVIGLANGISSLGSYLGSITGHLRTIVVNALANAGSLLYNAGRNIIIGLWNGIASLSSWLYSRVASFASNYVTNAIKGALGINSPSKVTFEFGQFLSQGMALGIEDQASKVKAAADMVAAAAIPDVGDATVGISAQADAISRTLSVDSNRSIQIGWKSGSNVDPFMKALQDHIEVVYNGNVDAAFAPAG